MLSYGFSLWLVPQSRFKIDTLHVPHITLATHFETEPNVQCTKNKRYRVDIFDGVSKFPSDMYPDSIVQGIGVYCKIQDMDLDHEPHLSLTYDESYDFSNIKLPEFIYCDMYLADTRSTTPLEWKLLKKY